MCKNAKIELLNVDCMEYMASCEDKKFDLAIVDPPYGIGESGEKNKSRGSVKYAGTDFKPFYGNDISPPPREYFIELERVSKNQIIWGANHFIHLIGKSSPCWIVWDKRNIGNHFADCELAYTSFKTAVRMFSYLWNGMYQEHMGRRKEQRIHPTQKPIKLYEWLLTKYANIGDKILDTHGGSMSSAIACYNLQFDMVLCEIDDHYFNLGKERYESMTSQKLLDLG